MAKKTIYAIPGTWEIGPGNYPATPIGMMKTVTDRLNRNIFDVQHVNYPARFGPIANNGEPPLSQLGSPSYADSVQMGVDEVVRLIDAKPGKFGVIGYSQGGAVASQVGQEILTGRLAHRIGDALWMHTFASPHRALGSDQSNTLPYAGISDQPIGGFRMNGVPDSFDWFDYCLPADIYGNANPDSYLQAGYEAVADMSLVDPSGWAQAVITSVVTGELAEVAADFGNPLALIRKTTNTSTAAYAFLNSGVHGRYNIDHIEPGWTPCAHSANHLNYWGARR